MATTIQISNQLRDEIRNFGSKGETYNDIIKRLLKSTKERQIQELLMDTKNTIAIDDAISQQTKEWRK